MKTRNAVLLTGVGMMLLAAGIILLKSDPQFVKSLPALPYVHRLGRRRVRPWVR
ncbi:MAG: hypothetical protein ACLSA6_08410 [Holdemania massiliensis]